MIRRSTRGMLTALIGASALMSPSIGIAPPSVAPATAVASRNDVAIPERVRTSRRTDHLIMAGLLPYMGHGGTVTGADWIRRRTNNFRRKAVGSMWLRRRGKRS